MKEQEIPRLNYDDFYKFVTSFSLITFNIGIFVTTFIFSFGNFEELISNVIVIFYFIIIVISVSFFIWATNKWYANQKELDLKLNASVTLDLLKMELAKLEYERKLDEAAKNAPHPFDFKHQLKRQFFRKRLD